MNLSEIIKQKKDYLHLKEMRKMFPLRFSQADFLRISEEDYKKFARWLRNKAREAEKDFMQANRLVIEMVDEVGGIDNCESPGLIAQLYKLNSVEISDPKKEAVLLIARMEAE